MDIKKIAFINSGGVYSHQVNREGLWKAFDKLENIELKEFSDKDLGQEFKQFCDINTIVFNPYPLSPHIRNLKSQGYKVVGYDQEGAYELKNRNNDIPYYTLMVTVDKAAWEWYSSKSILSYHMPLGADQELYKPMKVGPEFQSDILLVGVLFNLRVYYLSSLGRLKGKYKIRVICGWQERLATFNSSHISHVHVQLPFEETIKYINGAGILLTINRDYHPTPEMGDKNIITAKTPGRYYQEAACQAFQLMDDTRPEIYDYFEKDKEIITFKSSKDLIEKIDYYSENVRDRTKIAKAAYLRTMRDHTWDKRVDRLMDFMRKML